MAGKGARERILETETARSGTAETGITEEERAALEAELEATRREIAEANRHLADQEQESGELNHLNHFNHSTPKTNTSVIFNTFATLDKDFKKQMQPFPLGKLPDRIRVYIQAVTESLQVPVDMVATFALSVISLSVQGKYSVLVKPDWIEPLNLYTVVVGRPSERKSPALKEVTAPVFSYVKELNEKRQPEISQYNLQKKILTGRVRNMQEELIKKGDKAKYRMQDVLEVQKELDSLEEVALIRKILDDVTPEALVKALKENGETMAIMSAEGGIFGMMAGRYSTNANIDIFLKGYSGEHYSTVRIGREGQELEHPLLTICLAVQPQVISDIMDNKEFRGRGLLARFLYSVPSSMTGKREYRTKEINPFVKEQYETLVSDLLDIPKMDKPRMVRLSREADAVSEQYNQWIENRLTNEFEEIEDWAGKLHGNTMRLAGLFHIIKHRFESVNVPMDGETMAAAVEVGKYYLEHSKTAFDIMGLSDPKSVQDAKYIIKRLVSDRNDLNDFNDFIPKMDALRLCQRFKTAEEMQPGIDVLVEHGYIAIKKVKNEKRGRPQERIYINPEYIKYREEHAA